MPLIECTLIKGYDAEVRKRLAELKEVDPDNFMRGRTSRVPASAPRPAEEIVRLFLAAMEARDLDAAKADLADNFTMTFPGNARFTELGELVAWARQRYQLVKKSYEGFDTAFHGTRSTVFCFGTLSGSWLDGTGFSGIRFVDRFELEGETIVSQMVWNDMAEIKPA